MRRLPADTGAAYIVLQHLSPESPSQLARILQRESDMAVRAVESRERLTPDHVHVIAPASELVTAGGGAAFIHPDASGG